MSLFGRGSTTNNAAINPQAVEMAITEYFIPLYSHHFHSSFIRLEMVTDVFNRIVSLVYPIYLTIPNIYDFFVFLSDHVTQNASELAMQNPT